jgi:hypothetical protein
MNQIANTARIILIVTQVLISSTRDYLDLPSHPLKSRHNQFDRLLPRSS